MERKITSKVERGQGCFAICAVILLILSIFTHPAHAQPAGYEHRKAITLESSQISGSSDHLNFPVMVSLTDTMLRSTANGGGLDNPSGYDIVFTLSDKTTLLNHELQSYEPSTGEILFWVRMPSISPGADSTIYLYYGNSNVFANQSDTTTWNDDYHAVWHLEDLTDASGPDNILIDHNTSTNSSGYIGSAREFDGNGDDLEQPDAESYLNGMDSLTISMWVKADALGTDKGLIYSDVPDANDRRIMIRQDAAGEKGGGTNVYRTSLLVGTNNRQRAETSDGSASTSWQYLVMTRVPGSTNTMYIDGALDTPSWSTTRSGDTNKATTLFIGKGSKDGPTSSWDGLIDEVRILDVALSADWISTEYNNMSAPGSFLTISTANELPFLSDIESIALSYQANDPATLVSTSVLAHDWSEFELDSAKIQISGNYLSGEDTLTFTSNYGISGTWLDGSGTLLLGGTASISDYTSALREVSYQNSNSSPSTSTRTVSFSVNDSTGWSSTVTRDITMNAVNSAPVLSSIEGTTLAYTDGDPDTVITSTIVISDSDDFYLDSAWVTVSGNYVEGEDKLDFVSTFGITSSWSSVNGELTLVGNAAYADYQTALRSVTYENLNPDPDEATRTISYKVSDSEDHSNSVSRDLSVTAVNDSPILDHMESRGIVYQAGDGSIAITDSLTITDGDHTKLDSVVLQITSNYFINEDSLGYSSIYGITGNWYRGVGKLVLSGNKAISTYETAVRTVIYENVLTSPHTSTRVVSITAYDLSTAASNIESRNISSGEPATISDIALWLNNTDGLYTDNAGTAEAVDGDDVQVWKDQSGNGRDFENRGGTPFWRESVAGLNGESAVEFSGGGDNIRDPDGENYINGLTEFTVFFVVKSDLTSTDRGLMTVDAPGNGDMYFSIRYDAVGDNASELNVIKSAVLSDVAANEMESIAQIQSTDAQIVCLDWESGNVWDLYVDGVLNNPSYIDEPPSGSIANATRVHFGIGPEDIGWDGMIAEIVLYDRHLTNSERLSLEHYFSDKYAISVHLLEPATGGEEISADDANSTWTTLTGPRITEDVSGELALNGTIILNAPSGFEWDTGTTPAVSIQEAYGVSTTLDVSYSSHSSSQITFTVDTESSGASEPGEVIFSNIKVRPTTGTVPNSGNITNTGTTGPTGDTNFGTLTMIAGTPTKVVYTQEPTSGTKNEFFTPTITAEIHDASDNTIEESGTSISIALTYESEPVANLSGTTALNTDVSGQVSFNDISIDTTGDFTLTVSSSGLTSAESDTFSMSNPGQYTTFLVEKTAGGNILTQTAGVDFNIKISAVDGTETPDVNFNEPVVITSTGILSNGSGLTDTLALGVLASHTMAINSIGNFTITATDTAGNIFGASNTFSVESGPANAGTSSIIASPTVLANDAVSTSTITVQLKDAGGNDLDEGGATVNLVASAGTLLGTVTDNSDGTYTQTLRSSSNVEVSTITGVLNGNNMTDDATVQFNAYSNIWETDPGNDPFTTRWDTTVNWDNGLPDNSDAVLIPAEPADGVKYPIISTDNEEVSTMTVEATADVTLSGNISFQVLNDLLGGGDINGGALDTVQIGGDLDIGSSSIEYLEMNGSSQQTITSPLTFAHLEINNSTGVQIVDNLEVTDTLKLTSGSLIIPSGKSLIANKKHVSGGNLRIKREISGNTGWRLLSSPVSSTYGDLFDQIYTQGYTGSDSATGSPSVLWYDESYHTDTTNTDNQRWRQPSSSTDATVAGRGHFVYVFGSIVGEPAYSNSMPRTLDVSGTEDEGTSGEFNFGVTYTADADTGWNLIGNPFCATINWDAAGWTKTNMDNVIYVWDHTANSGSGAYLTWNGTSGSLGSGMIMPFQGFWVKANASSPVLKVPKTAKTSGGTFYKPTSEKPLIMLLLESDTLGSTTHIQFSDSGSRKKDSKDAHYLVPPTDTYLELYTESLDKKLLAIQNQPYRFGLPVEIPIYVGGFVEGEPHTGSYRLSWPRVDDLHEEWTVELIDQETGDVLDIGMNTYYEFDIDASLSRPLSPIQPSETVTHSPAFNVLRKHTIEAPRFILRVDPGNAFPEIPREYGLKQNYPNPFNSGTMIEFYLPVEDKVQLVVYDMLGREVDRIVEADRYPAGRHTIRWQGSEQASGLYFYRLQVGEKSFTKKMILLR